VRQPPRSRRFWSFRIELIGAVNAEVNADLRVGALEETITVSGASPVVDIKNTLSQTVLTKEQLEALPGGRTLKGRAALIPGVIVPNANTGVVSHGSESNDSNIMTDGYKSGQHLVGRGTGGLGVGWGTQSQEAAIEEVVSDTGGQGAEFASSGVRMNMIPKEGGNRFVAEAIAYGSNKRFESNKITPELEATGLKYAYELFAYDFNPTVGGPIKKDKLWYFASFSANNRNGEVLDIYLQAERAVDAGRVPGSSGRRPEPMVPRHHGRVIQPVADGASHSSSCVEAQAPLQLRQHEVHAGPRQLHDRRQQGVAGGIVVPAAVSNLWARPNALQRGRQIRGGLQVRF